MKCNEAEKFILLQASGELGAAQICKLENHLACCEYCRRFEQLLQESSHAISFEMEPSNTAVQNVLRAARLHAPEHRSLRVFSLKPALAMAASAAILLGIFLGRYQPNRVGMELTVTDAQLLEPEDQVVSVMYDGLSGDNLAFNFL